MAILTLALPQGEFEVTGKQITFVAPCNSEGVTEILIGSNQYSLTDSNGHPLVANAFSMGSMVSIVVNTETKKAYVLNGVNSQYLEDQLQDLDNKILASACTITDENKDGNIVFKTLRTVGTDGFSPIANVTETEDGAVIQITDVKGKTEALIRNGKDGKDGANGADGKDGVDGKDGQNGQDGADGYTPVRGQDYWTPEDMVNINTYINRQVESQLPIAYGTWTPLLYNYSTKQPLNATYNTKNGFYFKVGKMVFVSVNISTSAINEAASAGVSLPFRSSFSAPATSLSMGIMHNAIKDTSPAESVIVYGNSDLALIHYGSMGTEWKVVTGTSYVYFSGWYPTDN